MAEVDIVADAHQTNVIMPHLNLPTHHSTMPHMGVEPMQISTLRNNNKYGRKKQPRMPNGPRQERSNYKNGPPFSTIDMAKVRCWNCGRIGHVASKCNRAPRAQVSMLLSGQTNTPTISCDNEEVKNLHSEGAVDSAIQAEVPLDLHASLPIYQEKSCKEQPVQSMVVTTRQSTVSKKNRAASCARIYCYFAGLRFA